MAVALPVTNLIGVIVFAELSSTFAAKLPRCDHSVVTRLVFFFFQLCCARDFAELASKRHPVRLFIGSKLVGN